MGEFTGGVGVGGEAVSSQAERGVVGAADAFVEVIKDAHCSHGAEDFLGEDLGVGRYVLEDGGGVEITGAFRHFAADGGDSTTVAGILD